MKISSAAGKPADSSILVNIPKLIADYYELRPDPSDPRQRVVFGASGHRGSATDMAFNEGHILAITQAICDYRRLQSWMVSERPSDTEEIYKIYAESFLGQERLQHIEEEAQAIITQALAHSARAA